MNIRHLEILEAIEQSGTFTGAAKKLHLTQSAVSHAMAELEEQAGTALFIRHPKGAQLTHCGLSLLNEARNILSACRSLDKKIPHLEENTPINLVSSITIASFLLPRILQEFHLLYPELQVNVRVASASDTLCLLNQGEADLAFWEGAAPRARYRTILLGTYSLCAACSFDFPFSGNSISLEELCNFPLLLREPGSAIRDTFDRTLSIADLKVSPVWESVNSFSLIRAAEAGLGITILPENLLKDSFALKKLRPISFQGEKIENRMLAVLHNNKYITEPMKQLLFTLSSVTNTALPKSFL